MNLLNSIACLKALSNSTELRESPKLCADLLEIVDLLSDQSLQINENTQEMERLRTALIEIKQQYVFPNSWEGIATAMHDTAQQALENANQELVC